MDNDVSALLLFERYFALNCIDTPPPHDPDGQETEDNMLLKTHAWLKKYRGMCNACWSYIGRPWYPYNSDRKVRSGSKS